MTVIMIVMICLGCAVVLAGLGIIAYQGKRLAQVVETASDSAAVPWRAITRKSENLAPQLERLAEKQKEVAESFERISTTSKQLNYLIGSLDQATGRVFTLKR